MIKYSLESLCNSTGVNRYFNNEGLVPGKTQLFSKRSELYAPNVWPAYYSKAKGISIWDLDGREFQDFSNMSVGACIFGYADDYVDKAVIDGVLNGVSSTLNSIDELELAELLVGLHSHASGVRFAKSGGEAMAMAVRFARASTDRELVLFSGYHGWHDWYLSANHAGQDSLNGHLMPGLEPLGVPKALALTAIPFKANDIDHLKKACSGREKEVAAVIIEPARGVAAESGYLTDLIKFAHDIGAKVIFDEITSGYRCCVGGMHRILNVEPDISVLAKALGNGYPIAAVLVDRHTAGFVKKTFVSSTNWTERTGLAAAIATTEKFQKENAGEKLCRTGRVIKECWRNASLKYSIPINVSGIDPLPSFGFVGDESYERETFFTISMLQLGFLAGSQFRPSVAHAEGDLLDYAQAVDQVFSELSDGADLSRQENRIASFGRLTR